MFNPGETVMHTFFIPFEKTQISKVAVSYRSCGDVFFIKEITSDEIIKIAENESKIVVVMSQEESLLFKEFSDYFIQLNVFEGSSRLASKEIHARTGPQHIKEVISV